MEQKGELSKSDIRKKLLKLKRDLLELKELKTNSISSYKRKSDDILILSEKIEKLEGMLKE